MIRNIFISLVSVMLLSLAGCIQVETVVRVNPDGSGRVEETFLIKKEFAQLLKSMPKAEGQEQDAQAVPSLIEEEKLKKKGTEMGEGVAFVSAQEVVTEEFEGYRAVYSFADLNKLRIRQSPKDEKQTAPGETQSDKEELITFSFTKGDPSVLVVRSTRKATREADQGEKPAQEGTKNQGGEALMKTIMKDMRISMAIEVQGTIVETNAMYREGSRVTLAELDFGRLIGAPEKCERFTEAPPETMDEIKKFLKDCPGIKVDLNDEIRISFR